MPITVPHIVLIAKQLEIAELRRVRAHAHMFGVIGHLIHALQLERGASSIYLASSGRRFGSELGKLVSDAQVVEAVVREVIAEELENANHSNARIISLLGWAVLGLDALPELRVRIRQRQLDGQASVAAFSRLIAGMIELGFELADTAIDPVISRLLVGLFNLVEGKEHAGQERAVGALAFAAGVIDESMQQRLQHLIDAQARSFGVFQEFSEAPVVARWQATEQSAASARLKELRHRLTSIRPGGELDSQLSQSWFDSCSERIGAMWRIQRDRVETLQQHCDRRIGEAEQDLHDSEKLIRGLRESPPARAEAIDRFFDPHLPIEQSIKFNRNGDSGAVTAGGLIELLQAQSRHLATIECELAAAKRALNERKVIERAKGLLMARMNLSEEEAHKQLRKASMDQNLRLVDVAQSVIKNAGHP